MDQELLMLLKKFIEQNSSRPDLQFDPNIKPRLPINPYSKNYDEKRRVAHYFLLVASIDEGRLVGRADNARKLMVRLYNSLGEKLFTIIDVAKIEEKFNYARIGLKLGMQYKLIPEILASVNEFVENMAGGDLIRFARAFHKPYDFVDVLGRYINRMGKTRSSARKKAWMYMRWMVRSYPDLRIFDNFSPKDLYVPLDRNVARVAAFLGILSLTENLGWTEVEKVTSFARKLYPDDPAKIDYPFFLLGRMLRQRYGNHVKPSQYKLKILLKRIFENNLS